MAGAMGRSGVQRRSWVMVVFLSVVLLVGLKQVHADFGWFSTSTSEIFPSLIRGQSVGGDGESLHAETRRILADAASTYIGYGALSANSVPCPPQSGRSYYTPNCQSATGPVKPYTRGCSTITRCARTSR